MSRAQNTAPDYFEDDFEFDFDGFDAPAPSDFDTNVEGEPSPAPEATAEAVAPTAEAAPAPIAAPTAAPAPEPAPQPSLRRTAPPAVSEAPPGLGPLTFTAVAPGEQASVSLRRDAVQASAPAPAQTPPAPTPAVAGPAPSVEAFDDLDVGEFEAFEPEDYDFEPEPEPEPPARVAPEPAVAADPAPAPAPASVPAPAEAAASVRPVTADAAPHEFAHAAGFNPVGELLAGAEAALGEVSVPRIAIHVFAGSPQTLQAAQRAAADRRLSRATTTVRQGGVDVALEVYKHEPTPPLIILEGVVGPRELLTDLDRLAEVCDPGTKVVVVGRSNDIGLYRELIRRGVSEYVVGPVDPLGLIRAIASLYNDPSAPFVGRTIAFVGARGGTGSSTLAHNTAWAISEILKQNAVVVDLDLPFGTAGLDFNQDGQTTVVEALTAPERLDPVLMDRMMVRCTDRLSLFTAPATLENDYDLSPDVYDEVIQRIRGAAPFVVLDLPHAWNAWVRRLMLTADEVVVVATPDLAALRNAKNLVELAKAARPNDSPPRLVLNQVGIKDRPEIPVKEFGDAVGVSPCLVLPFDAKLFGQAANNGQMIGDLGKKSKSADGFAHLAQIVSRREPPAPEKSKSLFGALFKR
jgi:pilus assembly protein CpaE